MKKYICLFLSTLMFLTIFSPVNCYARDGKKIIRVGFYTMDNYQECDENGNYSGYFVDYLREISQYTGWEYEFIQMNYSACLKSLNDRNIDLVCGVDYSSFRTSTLDFSAQPAVTTHYELYALKDNDTYYYNDYADFDGISIGVLASCKQLDALDDYADAHHFSFEKQYFENTAQLEKALEDNTVDAIYATSVSHPSEKKILASLPSFPLYFVTFKGNPIMEYLNYAQAVILNVNPNFDHDLYTTYQQDIRNYRCEFTRDELDYLSTAPEITVTCDPSNAPIEGYNENTQTASGIAADVLDLVSQYTGLHFRYIKSDSFSDALSKLRSHEINMLTALAHDYSWAEQNHALLTTPYLNSSIVVVRNSKPQSHERDIVALPNSFNLTNSILDNPEYDTEDVVYYDTIEECFQAVLSGSADCTYADNYSANYLLSQVKYRNLSSTTLLPLVCLTSAIQDCSALSIRDWRVFPLNSWIPLFFRTAVIGRIRPSLPLFMLIRAFPFRLFWQSVWHCSRCCWVFCWFIAGKQKRSGSCRRQMPSPVFITGGLPKIIFQDKCRKMAKILTVYVH